MSSLSSHEHSYVQVQNVQTFTAHTSKSIFTKKLNWAVRTAASACFAVAITMLKIGSLASFHSKFVGTSLCAVIAIITVTESVGASIRLCQDIVLGMNMLCEIIVRGPKYLLTVALSANRFSLADLFISGHSGNFAKERSRHFYSVHRVQPYYLLCPRPEQHVTKNRPSVQCSRHTSAWYCSIEAQMIGRFETNRLFCYIWLW